MFRGTEEKMRGNVYQVDGEPGKRPNQLKRTTKKIMKLAMIEFYSPHLFEPMLINKKKPNLEEPEDPDDSASREVVLKCEMRMKKNGEEKFEHDEGLFGLRALIDGQG